MKFIKRVYKSICILINAAVRMAVGPFIDINNGTTNSLLTPIGAATRAIFAASYFVVLPQSLVVFSTGYLTYVACTYAFVAINGVFTTMFGGDPYAEGHDALNRFKAAVA